MVEFEGRWLLFVCLNVLAATNAAVAAAACRGSRDGVMAFLATAITLLLGEIILVETMLGVMGVLTSGASLAALLVILVALVGCGRDGISTIFAELRERVRATLSIRARKGSAIPAVLALWITVALAIQALAEPSTFPDTLSYHLPEVVSWIHARAIVPIQVPASDPSNTYFPTSGGLLYFWMVAPFGSDLTVRLTNLPMWLALALGLVRLARLWGASRNAAVIATVLFSFTPIVLAEATETALDVASAAAFVLALGHLYRFSEDRRFESALLFAIASGVFLGVKYSAPAYAVILGIGFGLVLVGMVRRRRLSARMALGWSCVFAVTVLGLGGYGYVRNAIATGNPMYPVRISVAGLDLPGLYEGTFYRFNELAWRWREVAPLWLARAVWRAVGLVFPFAVAVSTVWVCAARLWRPGRGKVLLLATLIAATGAIYVNTPYSVMVCAPNEPVSGDMQIAAGMRLGMITLALCTVWIALWMTALRSAQEIVSLSLGPAMLTAVVPDGGPLWGKVVVSRYQAVALAVLVVGALVVWSLQRVVPKMVKSLPSAIVLAMLAIAITGAALDTARRYRERVRYVAYLAYHGEVANDWEWIAEHLRGIRILFAGFNQSYPLYGPRFENQVRHIPVTDGHDAYENWIGRVGDWKAEYLIVTDDAVEARWADANGAVFRRIFVGERLRVYHISHRAET